MDKVIIDGVDVNKCGYYKDGDCLLCPVTCEEFIVCDFKEIKRLQAENERLKKSIDRIMQNKEIKTIDSEIALLNAELQQANKRLIARLRPLEDSYFNGLSSIEIAELAKISIRITTENRKLEYALQEIRDIAEKMYNTNDEDVERDLYIKLQDKINEVIGAE